MADKNDVWEDNIGGFTIVSGKKVAFLCRQRVYSLLSLF